MMQAGVATVDITPAIGCALSGFVVRRQPSVGLHSRLYARALCLEQGMSRMLWVHTDLIGFQTADASAIRAELATALSLAPEAIVLSATHTHAGPATLNLLQCGAYDSDYMAWLRERLFQAALEATQNLEPATLYHAAGANDLAIDRRGQASTHVDHQLGVLGWQREDGGYIAVLANYPVHNVALGAANRHISSDLFGAAGRRIMDALPGRPAVLFTNGACGNLNPPEHVTDFNVVEGWGAKLADTALEALARAEQIATPTLSTRSLEVTLPLDRHHPDKIRQWSDALIAGWGAGDSDAARRIQAAAGQWRDRMLSERREGRLPDSLPLEIQGVQLGPVRLVCLGAEIFSRFTTSLRQSFPGPLYVVGYANGDLGYIPTPEAFDEGGYEAESAFIFYNGYRVARDAHCVLLDGARAVLEDVD